jgi:hypothetical protein
MIKGGYMVKKVLGVITAVTIGLAIVSPASADFVVGGENGWQLSVGGWVNTLAVYQATQRLSVEDQARIADDNLQKNNLGIIGNSSVDTQSFRVISGYVPAILAFSVKAPTIAGIDMAARLGMYPNTHNKMGERTSFGTDFNGPRIDFREIYFTADGSFGQVLIGRAMNLYLNKNCMSDMTIYGEGLPGPASFGIGAGFGHVGTGYLYPAFGAQVRYTTPDLKGLKFALEVADPSVVSNSLSNGARKIPYPRVETELSYAKPYSLGKFQTWLSGFLNVASFTGEADSLGKSAGSHATSLGGAGGMTISVKEWELNLSTYGGQALGSAFMPDWDALDAVGNTRKSYGFFSQVTYQVAPPVKLGINYGQTNILETPYEKAQRNATGKGELKQAQSGTAAVYYDVNKYLKLCAEYSYVQTRWFSGVKQSANVGALGAFFMF